MEIQNSMVNQSVKSGLIIGSVSIAYFIILYIGGIMPIGIMKPILIGLLGFAVSLTLLIIYLRKYRSENDGFISFGNAFLFGFIALMTASAIDTAFYFLFNQFFDPEYTKSIIEAQKDYMDNYLSGKISDDQIQEALDKIDEGMNKSNLKQSLSRLLGGTIFALIVSLIVGAIMKKNRGIFDDQTQGGVI